MGFCFICTMREAPPTSFFDGGIPLYISHIYKMSTILTLPHLQNKYKIISHSQNKYKIPIYKMRTILQNKNKILLFS